jgi:hypothetical protein
MRALRQKSSRYRHHGLHSFSAASPAEAVSFGALHLQKDTFCKIKYKLLQVCPDEDKIDTSCAERADVAASVHGSPRGNGLKLPKSIESGNLSHNEAVIWWMPAICDFLQLFWSALE